MLIMFSLKAVEARVYKILMVDQFTNNVTIMHI